MRRPKEKKKPTNTARLQRSPLEDPTQNKQPTYLQCEITKVVERPGVHYRGRHPPPVRVFAVALSSSVRRRRRRRDYDVPFKCSAALQLVCCRLRPVLSILLPASFFSSINALLDIELDDQQKHTHFRNVEFSRNAEIALPLADNALLLLTSHPIFLRFSIGTLYYFATSRRQVSSSSVSNFASPST